MPTAQFSWRCCLLPKDIAGQKMDRSCHFPARSQSLLKITLRRAPKKLYWHHHPKVILKTTTLPESVKSWELWPDNQVASFSLSFYFFLFFFSFLFLSFSLPPLLTPFLLPSFSSNCAVSDLWNSSMKIWASVTTCPTRKKIISFS